MRCVSLVLIFIAATMATASGNNEKVYYDVAKAEEHFQKFITDNNRVYKDAEDREVHFRAFVANLEKINKLNENNPSATYGINKFADYTEEERKTMRGLGNKST